MTNPVPVKPAQVLTLLREAGGLTSDSPEITPLSGGVSSEIHRVRDGERVFVVKRALAKLNVADDWHCDPGRNRYEQRYLRYVSRFLPNAVPRLLFGDEDAGWFAMEYFGADFVNWKSTLLRGDCEPRAAQEAMHLLARIHAQSRGRAEVARQFDTTENFHWLRTDPYLLTTARRNPALAPALTAEAQRLESVRECLVHGDFSPKNMLLKSERLVLFDCEVAWYGDPAFDLAFFLNHLCLKSLYHAPAEPGLRDLFETAVKTYFKYAGQPTDTAASLDQRSARLLLMLLLARVDGKSPVEYLRDPAKPQFIRQFVYGQLPNFHGGLHDAAGLWFGALAQSFGPPPGNLLTDEN